MAKKLSYKYVKYNFELEGYTLISTTYKNSKEKLDILCPKGHKYNTSYDNFFSRGRRCKVCDVLKRSAEKRLAYNTVKETFELEGYKLLTEEYRNVEQKLDFICDKGHTHRMTFHNWQSGWRCVKCRAERQVKFCSGKNHPQWRGGISLQGYCSIWKDSAYKESIKNRDNYTCQNPYCYKMDPVLHIHHINYDKKNCHPNNLITICRACNAKANFNREWHTQWYQTIIRNRNLLGG